MKYQVIKKHKNEFPNPIIISKGDKFLIGEECDENEAWNDWYFCETQGQIKGWVPKQVIKWLSDGKGEALEDYSAKEMDVDEGDVLIGVKVLNGWVWCQHASSEEEGWVPIENLVKMCSYK